jgi:hypothetical protein
MSRVRIALPLLVVCLLAVAPAEAQKRRAVRSPAPLNPPVNNCHTFGLVRAGLEASYLTRSINPPQPDVTFTIKYISDTPTQTRTTQKVTTPQGTTDVETVLDGEVFGHLRGLKHFNVKSSTLVPVLGRVTIEVDVDFVPSLTAGPAAGWCVGNTWSVPAVTETITTKGSPVPLPPQVITTIASTGEVLAVGEQLTVGGRTHNTVKYRGVVAAGTGAVSTAITWVSMTDNIVVRQDTIDGNGAVTSTTTLTN